jgi:hypothetical protein
MVTSCRARQLGTLVTLTSPLSCSVVVTVPTGVSMPMLPGADATQVREGRDDADRAMAAHPDVADVVEEDHAGGARGIRRLDQQRADDHVRAARLVHDGGSIAVEVALKAGRVAQRAALHQAADRRRRPRA